MYNGSYRGVSMLILVGGGGCIMVAKLMCLC